MTTVTKEKIEKLLDINHLLFLSLKIYHHQKDYQKILSTTKNSVDNIYLYERGFGSKSHRDSLSEKENTISAYLTDTNNILRKILSKLDFEKTINNFASKYNHPAQYQKGIYSPEINGLFKSLDDLTKNSKILFLKQDSKSQQDLHTWSSIIRNSNPHNAFKDLSNNSNVQVNLLNWFKKTHSSHPGIMALPENLKNITTYDPNADLIESKSTRKVKASEINVTVSLNPGILSKPEINSVTTLFSKNKDFTLKLTKLLDDSMKPVIVDMSKKQAMINTVNKLYDNLLKNIETLKSEYQLVIEKNKKQQEQEASSALQSALKQLGPHLKLIQNNPELLKQALTALEKPSATTFKPK